MRRVEIDPLTHKPHAVIVTWGKHVHSDRCPKCQNVDMSKPATFVNACAEGSPLLMEELAARARPEVKRKEKEVLEWAKRAGVFKIPKGA